MVLRTLEQKIEALFEGVFGRAFRTHVQPVELARKLVKEMEDHRVVSVSRVYAPNEYTVYLAPSDREQFASYEDSLRSELQQYLAENARKLGMFKDNKPRSWTRNIGRPSCDRHSRIERRPSAGLTSSS